jgi:hypothetical protein
MGLEYLSISIASLALLLVVVIFIILIVQNSTPETPDPINKVQNTSKQLVSAYGNKHISISEPPLSVDGVVLRPGNMILLGNQNESSENGLYQIESETEWVRRNHDDSLMFINGGNENGRRLIMVSNENKMQNIQSIGSVILTNDDIVKETRKITVHEIMQNKIIIAESEGIELPDPCEFIGSKIGQIYKFDILNASQYEENILELGHSSNWSSKCDNSTEILPMSGATFVLRIISETTGELYRK